jgi:hypothetical protein
VIRLAHAISTGSFDPSLNQLETVWSDPESRSVAQSADAASKVVAAGLLTPDAALERYLGMSPTEIGRIRDSRRAAALDTAAVELIRRDA